jgi:hypothetical protein
MIKKSTYPKQKQNKVQISQWRMRVLHDYCRAFVCISTKSGVVMEVYLN